MERYRRYRKRAQSVLILFLVHSPRTMTLVLPTEDDFITPYETLVLPPQDDFITPYDHVRLWQQHPTTGRLHLPDWSSFEVHRKKGNLFCCGREFPLQRFLAIMDAIPPLPCMMWTHRCTDPELVAFFGRSDEGYVSIDVARPYPQDVPSKRVYMFEADKVPMFAQ